MLTTYFTRLSRARRRLVMGLMNLGAFGLLIAIGIRMQDPITYFLMAAMLLLGLLYGSMRVLHDLVDTPVVERAVRYRLAWLSARRRAIITRARLEFHTHRSWN